jgi:hypothetical protein
MIITSIVTGLAVAKLRSMGFLKFSKPKDVTAECNTSLPASGPRIDAAEPA